MHVCTLTHIVAVLVSSDDEEVELMPIARGDVTIHNEYVVHGSSGNVSNGNRRTCVVAYRTKETVEIERANGFTHSHNDG